MHWLEGADHSFHVLKSSGREDAQVMEEVGEASASWLEQRSTPGVHVVCGSEFRVEGP